MQRPVLSLLIHHQSPPFHSLFSFFVHSIDSISFDLIRSCSSFLCIEQHWLRWHWNCPITSDYRPLLKHICCILQILKTEGEDTAFIHHRPFLPSFQRSSNGCVPFPLIVSDWRGISGSLHSRTLSSSLTKPPHSQLMGSCDNEWGAMRLISPLWGNSCVCRLLVLMQSSIVFISNFDSSCTCFHLKILILVVLIARLEQLVQCPVSVPEYQRISRGRGIAQAQIPFHRAVISFMNRAEISYMLSGTLEVTLSCSFLCVLLPPIYWSEIYWSIFILDHYANHPSLFLSFPLFIGSLEISLQPAAIWQSSPVFLHSLSNLPLFPSFRPPFSLRRC